MDKVLDWAQELKDKFHFPEVEYRLTNKDIRPLSNAWRNEAGFHVDNALFTLRICLNAEQINLWNLWKCKQSNCNANGDTVAFLAPVDGRLDLGFELEEVGNELYVRGNTTLIYDTLRQIFPVFTQ